MTTPSSSTNSKTQTRIKPFPSRNPSDLTKGRKPTHAETNSSRFTLTPEIGFTSLSYQEDNNTSYNAILLSPRINSKFITKIEGVSFYGNLAFHLFPLVSSSQTVSTTFYSFELGGSYVIPNPNWQFAVSAGSYYQSMSVTNNQFGFSNLYGINIKPSISKNIGSNQFLGGYFKYGPALNSSSWSNTSNAIGVTWKQVYSKEEALEFTLNYSFIRLRIDQIQTRFSAFSLSLTYTGLDFKF